MKDWKSITAFGGVVMTAFTFFCYAPIPLTTGNVTGARYLYNIWDEHKKEDEAARLASVDRDAGGLREVRESFGFVSMQLRLQALQNDRTHYEHSDVYSPEQRRQRVEETDRRLQKLHRDMERKGIKIEDIQSFNDGQIMLAYKQ